MIAFQKRRKLIAGGRAKTKQKGEDNALDHCCHSFDFVVVRIHQRLCPRGIHSSFTGDCHRCSADQNHSGAKAVVIDRVE